MRLWLPNALSLSESGVQAECLNHQLTCHCSRSPTPPSYTGPSQSQIEAQIEYWNGGCTVHVSLPLLFSGRTVTEIGPCQPLGGAEDDGPALLLAFEKCRSNSIINLPGPLYTVEKVLNTTLFNTTINLDGVVQFTYVAAVSFSV